MSARNLCAACGKPIGIAYLMCAAHWQLVPRAMQAEVYRAWGFVQRGGTGTAPERVKRITAYRAARDAAVNHVRKRIAEQGAPNGHARQDSV